MVCKAHSLCAGRADRIDVRIEERAVVLAH